MARAVAKLSGQSRTAGQTVLQFVLKEPAVCSVAAGMRTEEQLVDNVGAVEAETLNKEQYQQLGSVLKPNVYLEHR